MYEDFDRCVAAVRSRDSRFDGWFYVAVRSTRIYCRPSCPAPPSKVTNYTFYPSAAAAQQAGYRACKRCSPDASPGSPEWNLRADLAARAMRLIADGVIDRHGVTGLADRLGYSTRQVERLLRAELGAGPLALAQAQRAQTARLLIETTTLPVIEVALAAGFGSVRAFNDTVRAVFAMTPSELRARARRGKPAQTASTLSLKLPFRSPINLADLFRQLAAAAVPGVEEWRDGAYRRTMRLPRGHGIVALRPAPDHIGCQLMLTDLRDLTTAISRCRWLLDLDADPVATDRKLSRDLTLAELIARHPGRRVPRSADGTEVVVRTILTRREPSPAARARLARVAAACGEPVADTAGGLTHLFPTPEALLEVDQAKLAVSPARRATLAAALAAIAAGRVELGVGADWQRARTQLAGCHGMGATTIELIAMQALGDPDAFPVDARLRVSAARLGLPATGPALTRHAAQWRPWRAYGAAHLWTVA